MNKHKLFLIKVFLILAFIFWPIFSGLILLYLQYQFVFNQGYTPSASSLIGLIFNVMPFRILVSITLPFMILVIARRIKNKKSRWYSVISLTYIICVVGLTIYFSPYSFWKARIIKPPPQTYEKSYRYKITSITESSETEIRYKSSTRPEAVLDFYYDLLQKNGLCLGEQSLYTEQRCYPKNQIDPGRKMWTINTIKPGKIRKADGLNWGFIHYLGGTEENYTQIWITLNNYKK